MTTNNVLHELQKNVKAPKDLKNNFGNYNYRNAEGILLAAKSVMPEGMSIVLSDEVVQIGDCLFLKAKATLKMHNDVIAEAFGFAGHPMEKKGMDFAQITGASSSYARKYALQGLLALDDSTDDPDATNKHGADNKGSEYAVKKQSYASTPSTSSQGGGQGPKLASDKQKGMIQALGKKISKETSDKIKKDYGILTLEQYNNMTSFTASKIIDALQRASEESNVADDLNDEIPWN